MATIMAERKYPVGVQSFEEIRKIGSLEHNITEGVVE